MHLQSASLQHQFTTADQNNVLTTASGQGKDMAMTTMCLGQFFVIYLPLTYLLTRLQCFDTVGWAAGRASGL